MPEGIIRDPKMNNVSGNDEKRFGILYSLQGGYLAYDKEDRLSELRFITAGTEFTFDHVAPLDQNSIVLWDGQLITHKVTLQTGASLNKKEGPVVAKLNLQAKNELQSKTPAWQLP